MLATVILIGWPSSVYLWYQSRSRPLPPGWWATLTACFATAAA